MSSSRELLPAVAITVRDPGRERILNAGGFFTHPGMPYIRTGRDVPSTLSWTGIDFADDVEQVSSIRLFYDPKDTVPAGVRSKHVTAVSGVKQNFRARQAMRDEPSSAEPSHSRHTKVKDDDIWLDGLCLRECLIAIARAFAMVIRIGLLQEFTKAPAYRLVVIHDKDFHPHLPYA